MLCSVLDNALDNYWGVIMTKNEEDKVWKVWNYMEQTYDCLRCGSRWDFQADCVGKNIDTFTALTDDWGKRHEDCEPSEKGDSLNTYNEWYQKESTVTFDISEDQLFSLIKIRMPQLDRNQFDKDLSIRSNYITFRSTVTRGVEIHRLYPSYRFYMFRQMWEPDSRQDLIESIKRVGGTIVGKEECSPMPKSKYRWHAPRVIPRQPERVWN